MRFKRLRPFLASFIPGAPRESVDWFQRLQSDFPYVHAHEFACGTSTIVANTVTVVEYTVAGLSAEDVVSVNPTAALPAGIGVVGAYVSAVDELTVLYGKFTAGNVALVEATFRVLAIRY